MVHLGLVGEGVVLPSCCATLWLYLFLTWSCVSLMGLTLTVDYIFGLILTVDWLMDVSLPWVILGINTSPWTILWVVNAGKTLLLECKCEPQSIVGC